MDAKLNSKIEITFLYFYLVTTIKAQNKKVGTVPCTGHYFFYLEYWVMVGWSVSWLWVEVTEETALILLLKDKDVCQTNNNKKII